MKNLLYGMRDRRKIELRKDFWKEKKNPLQMHPISSGLLKPDWTSDVFQGHSSLLMGQTTNDKLFKME